VAAVVLDPPEVSAEPQAWRCIGEEVSEQLDYEPARFLRRRLVRRKWVKREEAHLPPAIAPLPPVLQERCVAAPGLLAQIITAKFCDHLPLYRQEQNYRRRHGVDILHAPASHDQPAGPHHHAQRLGCSATSAAARPFPGKRCGGRPVHRRYCPS
jgi:transposase